MQEEAQDIVRFRAVYNDGEPESTILLTGLKNIFQKQLPKMPRDYVGKVVYDKYHASMCLYKPATLEVVGGITYKPFFDRKFIEIVFCAISSTEQVKGYGARLMNHLKDYVRSTGDLRYFLTCADNYAIGYFRKQGFTTEITLDKAVWMGYIKDYEGATVMQCTLVPRVKYLDVHETLAQQKRDLYHRIFRYSRCNVIHPGLSVFRVDGGLPIDPMSIPGLAETGWTPELSRERAKPPKSPLYILFTQLLDDMRNHADSWPFLEPVDPNHVQGYYDIIKEPMDLRTLEQNIEADRYHSLESFGRDVQKIFDNCRTFNEPTTKYYKAGNGLERYFNARKDELAKKCKEEDSSLI
ncbi:Bromodomain-containing protein [Catenaria anguillulae PL171]|uniref:histone acetyltransferase n=1 Tax=Catenaria anguillulae PL171 TaxID=765915 RepID=A0A1Y2HWB9_9FUNG|nr:Bromodomain-containing protein [Catenaria anguillulae PL171]